MFPTIHASCVSRDDCGILILGRPGRGKSRLALGLVHAGLTLVADDRVLLTKGTAANVPDGARAATPPQPAGTRAGHALLEVRGLGLVEMPCRDACMVRLVIDLDAPPERLPDHEGRPAGQALRLSLDPDDPAAVARALAALACIEGRWRLRRTRA